MAVHVHHRLSRREAGATDADSEMVGKAAATLTGRRHLMGGASLRTRSSGGGRLGGRVNVKDKSCVGVCFF